MTVLVQKVFSYLPGHKDKKKNYSLYETILSHYFDKWQCFDLLIDYMWQLNNW